MKRVTASEARRQWFRLLDEVLDGEVIAIIRKGERIIIRRDNAGQKSRETPADYTAILKVPDAERADVWSWDWPGPEGDVDTIERDG